LLASELIVERSVTRETISAGRKKSSPRFLEPAIRKSASRASAKDIPSFFACALVLQAAERLERRIRAQPDYDGAERPLPNYKRCRRKLVEVDSPAKISTPSDMDKIEEPIIKAMIITDSQSVGGILQLCQDKRGTQKNLEYLSPTRVMLTYELPLNEIVLDFYDRLKSVSRGYASLDYQLAGYKDSDLVKLDVLVGGEPVDALAMICHREQSYERGRELVSRCGN